MLNRRLDSLDTGLTSGYLEGILKVVADTTALNTDEEMRAEVERFKEFIGFELEEFKAGTMSSAQLNSQFESILINIHALYKHLQLASSTQRSHRGLAASDHSILEQGILRLLEDVKVFRLLKLNTDWNDARLVTFRDGRNNSVSRTKAEVQNRSRTLTQRVLRKRSLSARAGNFKPSATVTIVSDGVSGSSRKDYGPEKALDPDQDSFWAEVLFTDSPVRSKIRTLPRTELTASYAITGGNNPSVRILDEEIYEGFVVQLTVDYKQLELVNTIEMLPFGLFPVRILNVEYSTSGIVYVQVPGFEEPTASLSWFSMRFDPVPTRYIKVTLLQESYRAQIFHVPKGVLINNAILNSIADEDLRISFGDREDSEIETRLAAFDTDSRRVLDALGRLDTRMGELLAPSTGQIASERLAVDVKSVTGTSDVSLRTLNSDTETPKLAKFDKVEYILGLLHLEASLVEYYPECVYVSPTYTVDGTLFEVAVSPEETHVTLSDDMGSYPATTIEYELEIGPFRSKPILPLATSTVDEVIPMDGATRTGYVRFDTATSSPTVRRNGYLVNSTDITFTPSERKLEIARSAFIPGASYLVNYTPSANQDTMDIRALFDSVQPRVPEEFNGTDPDGRVRLSAPPFINYSIVYSDLFYKLSDEAKYFFKRGDSQELIDGFVYGTAETALIGGFEPDLSVSNGGFGISSTASYITSDESVSLDAAGFYSPGADEPPGIIQIDGELISYTGISSTTFTGCTRGIHGTSAATHVAGSVISSTGLMFYEPIEVFVEGIRARNITNYDTGEHPAFTPVNRETRVHTYIQAGSNIYFSKPITRQVITVKYNVLAQYLKLKATLKSAIQGRYGHTAELSEIKLYLNTAEI